MSVLSQVSFNPAQPGADAGGILRVGMQTTLFDGKELNAENTNIRQSVGTGTGIPGGNKYQMDVGVGQYFIRQSKRRFPYFSGKSQRIEMTFDKFAPESNVVKRFGYFSSSAVAPYDTTYDGFYVENTGTTIKLVCERIGTKTLELDITQRSGYNDLGDYKTLSTRDNFTVCEFKFLWLGGAVLVFSIKTDDGFVEAHRFNYSGHTQDIFILSPNQPVRYEIRSTTGTGAFRPICSQVATEGSTAEGGEGLTLYNPTAITTNTVGTIYALMGIKKQTVYRDSAVQLVDMSTVVTSTTADSGILMVIINPTLSAPLTYSNLSKIQVAYATTQTITAGTGRAIVSTPAQSTGAISAVLDKNYLAWLCSSIDNNFIEYVLAYMPVTANQTVHGILNIKEY